jgi:hypothetical protein
VTSRRSTCTWRAGLLLACCAVAAAPRAETLEAIPLQFRLAEEVIPILQPLLPAGAALTGTGDVLLLRADEATIDQVRRALATIDRAPRQLRITVGQSVDDFARRARIDVSGTVATDDVQVGVNRPPGAESSAQVVVQGKQVRDDVRSTSSVTTLEGREAYVAIGESRPFTTSSTGFFATPRVSADSVTVEISPVQQRFAGAARNPVVEGDTLTTTVSGKLGEWIALGGIEQARGGTASGIVSWGARSDLTRYSAWVKVEEIR